MGAAWLQHATGHLASPYADLPHSPPGSRAKAEGLTQLGVGAVGASWGKSYLLVCGGGFLALLNSLCDSCMEVRIRIERALEGIRSSAFISQVTTRAPERDSEWPKAAQLRRDAAEMNSWA